MRLKKLKLSGFKSFVDSTDVLFPGNLVAIVGPNGCGKSNIIDAVRWVMGEVSARHLRGDLMADVVFNGSALRKPVGQASVEMLFDNSGGRLVGKYAAYNEIAVKRVVNRDGQSGYFLNNSRCRRRDIMDIFLGTGLGPRSYAIIEQGTISRVIEAKPYDLRLIIEEAAGISRFRERRRETENRISHTRENLLRINDLRNEITRSLGKLKRQAQAAARFKQAHARERELGLQALYINLADLTKVFEQNEKLIKAKRVEIETANAGLTTLEARMNKLITGFEEANEEITLTQEEVYKTKNRIDFCERELKQARAAHGKLSGDLDKTSGQIQELSATFNHDQQEIDEITLWLERQTPQFSAVGDTLAELKENYMQAEKKWHEWQEIYALGLKINNFSRVLEDNSARKNKLEFELKSLVKPKQDLDFASEEQKLLTHTKEHKSQTGLLHEELKKMEQNLKLKEKKLDESKTSLQTLRGQLSSLLTLQGDKGSFTEPGVKHKGKLLENIKVSPGWEKAVETVLKERLESLLIDEGFDFSTFLSKAKAFNIISKGRVKPARRGSLGEVAHCEYPLNPQLDNVLRAETLSEALTKRSELDPNESVILADGTWIGPNWFYRESASFEDNKIKRAAKIAKLRADEKRLVQAITELEYEAAEITREILRINEKINRNLQKISAFELEVGKLQNIRQITNGKHEEYARTKSRLEAEISELDKIIGRDRISLEQAQIKLKSAKARLDLQAGDLSALERDKDELKQRLISTRTDFLSTQEGNQDLLVEVEKKRARKQEMEIHITRLKSRLDELDILRIELEEQISQTKKQLPELQKNLSELINAHGKIEKRLAAAKSKAEKFGHERMKAAAHMQKINHTISTKRKEMEELKLKSREFEIKIAEVEKSLAKEQAGIAIPETQYYGLKLDEVEAELTTVRNKIALMGAVNLAAEFEWQTEQERKQNLDRQYDDLANSLQILEQAIAKIDLETKTRFKETFERVNQNFSRLFPELFGGGKAYISLDNEDALSAGVNLFAQPPGKRNSNVYLLSGGEKALTAVALIFAIFELNPAPFCMLDEVDASLDDANAGRFCAMLKKMAPQVQFIIVTHNKITMQFAGRLTGITMEESGVSRIVAVDIDKAVDMI